MVVKKDTIRYVADLARLSLTPGEEKLFASQLSDILVYMEKLNKLNTDSVEAMSHAVSMGNVFREDVIRSSLAGKEALRNAPSKKDSFFKVLKVIE